MSETFVQRRGELTDRIKQRSVELFGWEITQEELRLLPYLMYVMINEQKLDPNRINQEERQILTRYRNLGFIEGGAGGMRITKEFWDIMCELVRLGYVDLSE